MEYLPQIFDKLLADTQADIDYKLVEADEDDSGLEMKEGGSYASYTFKVKGDEGQKKLSINTNALETKINSV